MTGHPRAPRLWLVDLLVVLVAVVWGSSYLATKEIATGEAVVALLALRFLAALPFLAFQAAGKLRGLSRAEVRGGAVLGAVLSVVLLLETYGVVYTSATNAGLIISLTMVFTPLAEAVITRTRPRPAFVAAAGTSVVGVLLLTQGSGLTVPRLGDLLMLLAAVVRTAHVLVMHRLKSVRHTDSGVLTFVQLATAVVVFGIASPLAGHAPWALAAAFGTKQWLLLVHLAVMCTLFAFLVQMWAVRRTSPSHVSLLLGTEPMWAAVIGVAFGGDRPGVAGGVGVVLVLVGIWWGRREAPAATEHAAPPQAEQVLQAG
ncbi:EamA family transporter [Streptomyces tateyamensis]|uniref:EamA family transporter n=1 Tax=Streptomyces tateyamensis TaxID=565073 RepID=A0A2V4NCA9_9ACTN|nr:DMT family transporter [Streptomyces tateyamensis]PYC76760.1 EamA family transporter [Streptomyces tateyamensis]